MPKVKRAYTTPLLKFESLSAQENVSSVCTIEGGTQADYVCPIFIEELGFTIFDTSGACTTDGSAFCYHVPTDAGTIFGS